MIAFADTFPELLERVRCRCVRLVARPKSYRVAVILSWITQRQARRAA